MPNVIFIDRDGNRRTLEAKPGLTLLEIAQRHGLDLEGACEGSLACSTCHLVIAKEWFDRLPPPSEEEADMLDLAAGLTRTSRLSCQLVMEKELDGLEFSLPVQVRNMVAGE
jgi:2Fe-2S ferredoxin